LFNTISFDSKNKNGCTLQKNSLLRRGTFSLSDYFIVADNVTDFDNNKLPSNKKIFPGAFIK